MQKPSEHFTGRRGTLVFALLLTVATFLAYEPVWRAGFIWDDNLLISGNPLLQQGDGWWRVWLGKAIDYVPAVSATWWLEWRLWQENPPAFHLVNLLWHVLDSLLLWRVLARLRVPGAALAAAIFALHPVNVETAAWVAEQKNTEALFFCLAAVWCHLQFEDEGRWRWHGLAVGAFVLALACKTAVAPLPVVLLGIAWWRRGRVGRRDALASVPFFVLAAAAAFVAVWIQKGGVAEATAASVGLPARVARAGQAVWFYLGKDLWPAHLVSIYPKWSIGGGDLLAYVPGLLLVAVLAAAWRFRGGWGRPLLFGLGYFGLMLLPVLGFLDISLMRYAWVADHWQYFAIIGPVTLAAAAVQTLAKRSAMAGAALAFLILTACAGLTWRQARIYKSGQTFWGEFMRVNAPAIAAYDEANACLARGQSSEAVGLFRKAIELQPAFSLPYNSLASLCLQEGRLGDALPLLQTALELRPDFPEAQENLGRVLLAQGQTAAALDHLQRAADLRPRDAAAQDNFGKVLLQTGLAADALAYFQKATVLRPDFAEAQNDCGSAFEESGRFSEAIASYEKALRLRPDFIPACNNLAWLLATAADASARNGPRAVELAQRANQLAQGKNPVILGTLAAAYAEAGRPADAVKTIDQALPLAAGNPALLASLKKQRDSFRPAAR